MKALARLRQSSLSWSWEDLQQMSQYGEPSWKWFHRSILAEVSGERKQMRCWGNSAWGHSSPHGNDLSESGKYRANWGTMGMSKTWVWKRWEWVMLRYGLRQSPAISIGIMGVRITLKPVLQGEIPFLLLFFFSLRPGSMWPVPLHHLHHF